MTTSKKTPATAATSTAQTKDEALAPARRDPAGQHMNTDHGVGIPHTDDSLRGGPRGPTLLEDFHLREKITRFDHERIPERAVHARGSAAHGYFELYKPIPELTKAAFLNDTTARTPVFVRFSTVVGSRGSADTARDVRGFATKFYTQEGNFDLVGNNIPVFFIQDGIKFPDLVHAVKPEPHHEMPQAASAHDTFWDFASLVPETTHMLMWVMSDRAIPRSFSRMEGFGVHTFRLVNAAGKSVFVKFHWKPLLGVHSLVWDEAQELAGRDADFHRRDLWESIERGEFPQWELGVQVVSEADEMAFDFDLLDATKIIPEELVPVQRIGRMTLDRNPDNFFAETEQVAFLPSNVVPGIDFTNDPLLQARLFSYQDTQLTRLGGPNFAQIPINRPVVPVHNHQQDGFMQQTVPTTRANYHPNSIGGGCPMLTPEKAGGFAHFPQRVEGQKIRERSASFADHYSQATLFWNSMSEPEKRHLVKAVRFELSKVERRAIRQRQVDNFANVDADFARRVCEGIDVDPPTPSPRKAAEGLGKRSVKASPALSMADTVKSARGRQVAALVDEGYSHAEFSAVAAALEAAGARVVVVGKKLGPVKSGDGAEVDATKNRLTVASSLFDAVYIPGGASAAKLAGERDVRRFVEEAWRHCKPIGATGEGVEVLTVCDLDGAKLAAKGAASTVDRGLVTCRATDHAAFAKDLIEAIAKHRHWERER
ncbi:MAG: catalase [Deltaproteobacteria bacterium]|nr:catalase [Myxococcales bacterium]MDP3213434.1 catalase [Deltaproteobacteria bacterium]